MIDFVGRTTSVVDEASKWGNYFGGIDERAQRRWMDREARSRYDEENRYQLERAQSNRDAYAGRAGLFTGADASFGDMEMRNEPAAQIGPMSIAPPTGGGLATETQTTPNIIDANRVGVDMPYIAGRHSGRPVGESVMYPHLFGQAAMPEDQMNISQRTTWRTYQRMLRARANGRTGSDETITRAYNAAVATGAIVEPQNRRAYYQAPEESYLPQVDPQADLQSGSQPDTQAAAPTNGPGSPTYRGEQDTSGALQPTPEMRMIETVMQDNLRLANIAARHGRNTEAEQHFAQALQSQAALLQQSRLLMLRAGAQGHRSALADLIGLYSGRPNGTTHIVEAGDGRFHIEVDTRDGRRTATANPLTMDELFSRAEYLVDRESVAARSEANSEIIRANIAAGAQIRVAQINAMSSREEQIVRAAIANADNQTRERIARGDVDFVVDSTNNRAYLRSFEPGPNGEMQPVITEISPQEVQVPSVDGNQTEQQMVGRRVTGVAGLRTN